MKITSSFFKFGSPGDMASKMLRVLQGKKESVNILILFEKRIMRDQEG